MRKALLSFALAAALAPVSCGGSQATGAKDPYIDNPNASGKSVVLVIDRSKSMDFNDTRHFNEQGSQVAVAISSSSDNLGLVAFSTDSTVVSKLQALSSKNVRLEFQRQINALGRDGLTNYATSLADAAQMLVRSNAGKGASVIFLTDGDHNQGPKEEVLKQATVFAQRGWRVFVIALGEEAAASELAKEIAIRTEAAYFPVTQAEEVMQAFLKILAQVSTFVAFDGGIRPIGVLPGTRRLVYLMIKESKETTISQISRNGSAVDWTTAANVYKYPVRVDLRGDFEAVNIESPEAGTWEATITGPAKVGWILQQPAFSLSLEDGAPAGEYKAGQVIQVGLKAEGNADAIAILDKSATAKAVVTGATGAVLGEFDLKAAKGGAWRGSTTATLADAAAKDELQTVVVKFSYKEESGGSWSHETRATVKVTTGITPAAVNANVKSIALGSMWSGAPAVTREIEISNTGTSAVDLKVKSNGDQVTVEGGDFNLAPGAKRTVKVTLAPKGASGAFEEAVVIEGRNAEGTRVRTDPIKVTWKTVELTGKPEFSLGRLKPGEAFKVPVEYAAGDKKLKMDATIKGAEDVKVVEEGGKWFVTGRLPKEAEEGTYTGELKVSVEGEALLPRSIPATYDIGGVDIVLVITPAKIEITTDLEDEWAAVTVTLKLDSLRDAKSVKFALGELKSKGQPIPTRRQKSEGKDWDASKGMKAGEEVTFTFSVKPGNDDAKTDYEGVLKVKVDDGKKTKEFEIPVKVTLKK